MPDGPGSPSFHAAPTLPPDGPAYATGPGADGRGPLRQGQSFAGRYHVKRLVGIGGMGAVYQAWDTVLGEDVAIKLIRPEILANPRAAAEIETRFKRELQLARRVAHGNVVRIHDIGEADALKYITMSYVDGPDLATLLASEGPFTPRRALRISRRITAALVAAHAAGVVHRDLKPANLLIGRGDHVWLTDFGVAQLASDATTTATDEPADAAPPRARFGGLTRAGSRIGTPEYMAPEQARGERADARVDVYAVGLILYDMLAGDARRDAFPNADAELAARLEAPPPRVKSRVPEVPDELDAIIAKCLAPDPERRYQTSASLAEALAAVGEDGATTAGPATATGAAVPAERGTRAAVFGLGFVVALALLLAVMMGYVAVQEGWIGGERQAATAPAATAPAQALSAPATDPRSVAVLPFEDLSEQRDQAYLAEGIAEELLNELAQVPDLRVPGRRSSFSFQGRQASIAEIGTALNVAHVLDGSIRKAGDRLRISAQLVRTGDGVQVWTKTFDRELRDVFAVQDEIAGAVVQALKTQLLPSATAHRTRNPEAYAQYLLGRSLDRGNNFEASRRAAEAYRRAIALDPAFAPAYAGLASAVSSRFDETGDAAYLDEAMRYAERAVELAPDYPGGWVELSRLRGDYRWDWAGASADLARAVALAPNDPIILRRQANVLSTLGRAAEAVALQRRALAADPLVGHANLGLFLLESGQLDEAETVLQRALQLEPDSIYVPTHLASVDLVAGRYARARERCESIPDLAFRLWCRGLALHSLGDDAGSRAALQELKDKHSGDCAYQIAEVHFWRGEIDDGFAWLDRAYRQRDGGMTWLGISRFMEPARGDPRYRAMLDKVGLAN